MTAEMTEPKNAERQERPNQTNAQTDSQTKAEIKARTAWVGRTRSGSVEYNTLTPRWEFAFSV